MTLKELDEVLDKIAREHKDSEDLEVVAVSGVLYALVAAIRCGSQIDLLKFIGPFMHEQLAQLQHLKLNYPGIYQGRKM